MKEILSAFNELCAILSQKEIKLKISTKTKVTFSVKINN